MKGDKVVEVIQKCTNFPLLFDRRNCQFDFQEIRFVNFPLPIYDTLPPLYHRVYKIFPDKTAANEIRICYSSWLKNAINRGNAGISVFIQPSPLGATPSFAMKAMSGYSSLIGACSLRSTRRSPTLRCSQEKVVTRQGVMGNSSEAINARLEANKIISV